MKKSVTLALLLCLGLGAYADKIKNSDKLCGIWQQVQQAKDGSRVVRLPVWKVMQTDNHFSTFLIANEQAKSIITNRGEFKVTSDSTLIEYVKGSITDPELVGKSNKITYKLVDDDTMHISYKLPDAMREGHETWVRLKLEIPE
jgi:hypothetical protein